MDGNILPASRFKTTTPLIAVASGAGAAELGCAHGAEALREYGLSQNLESADIPARWHEPIGRAFDEAKPIEVVAGIAERLASLVHGARECGERPVVIGGDHSCAIGTWNGVYHHLRGKGPMGLVWIDAHLDSHTHDTTPSGNLHGMPVAALLGYGDARLTEISRPGPAVLPENLCLLGVRSYETDEMELLRRLGVRVITMGEVQERGVGPTLDEAITIASRTSAGFGLSLDLDAVDPRDAPGVGSPVPGGIPAENLVRCMRLLGHRKQLQAIEIAEYNPSLDQGNKTRDLIESILIAALA